MDLTEAKQIMAASDPTDPLYAQWKLWKYDTGRLGDAVRSEIDGAFARAYPGEVNLSDDEELFRKLNEKK